MRIKINMSACCTTVTTYNQADICGMHVQHSLNTSK